MKVRVGIFISLALLIFGFLPSEAVAASRPARIRRLAHIRARTRIRMPIRAHRIVSAAGIYVQTLAGETLLATGAEQRFNPASVMKIATSLTALEQLGYDYRFSTSIYTNGTQDPTGKLQGDLIVLGAGDPAFFSENAFFIVEKLRSLGITAVAGDLVIVPPFYLNFDASPTRSAAELQALFEGKHWTESFGRAWARYLADSGRRSAEFVGISFDGKVRIEAEQKSEKLQFLVTNLSRPLCDLLKSQNDFSNNFMAEAVGRLIGGPRSIERFLTEEVGLSPTEVHVGSASGLGENWITPKAALKLLRHFYESVNAHGRKIEELLPVAGVDAGTLADRFTAPEVCGSVVAKTGTLASRHASALVGVAYTRERGVVLFAILNRDAVLRARNQQDEIVNDILSLCGGPAKGQGSGIRGQETGNR